MADAGASAPLACTDVPLVSPPETVALAGGRAALRDARRHRCPQARSQPGGQASWQRSSRYAALRQPHCVVPPGRCGRDSRPRTVHRRPACPQAVPPGRPASPGSYARAGSAEGAVSHSLRLVMHVAVHKTARVPCSGWPGRVCLAFRAGRVRPGRGVVPPEWEECGGHQAGAEACLAEQAG
jgi:hypothetical protein